MRIDAIARTARCLPGALVRLVLGAALATTFAGAAHAFPGELDLGYGTNGIAARTVNSSDFAYAATGANMSYVTGVTNRGTSGHLFVARFAVDGSLDPAFGTAGRTMLRLDQPSEGNAIRIQPDGRIVVAGTLYASSSETLVVRFNPDGTPDTTFAAATGGVFTRRIGGYSGVHALALQTDGKVLVGGYAANATNDGYVMRLNADGTADATFGVDGVRTLDWRGGFDGVSAVAEFVGKIYVAGIASNGPAGPNDFAYARLNADGSVDTTFGPPGQNGMALVDVDGDYDAANTFVFDGLGSIYIGGTSRRSGDLRYCMSVVKMTTNGIPVAGWGNNGRAIVPSFSGDTVGYSLGVNPAGVVIAGTLGGRFAMARFTPAGTLDATFGTAGIVEEAEGTAYGAAALGTPDAASYLVVSAGTELADPDRVDIQRLRYTLNGARDTSYGTGGRTLTNLYTLSWDLRAVAARGDGTILVAGMLHDALDSDFVIAGLKADGTFGSFGRGGLATAGFGKAEDRANALLARPDGSIVAAGRSVLLGTGSFALAGFTSQGNRDYAFGQGGRVSHTMGIGYAEINALANAPGNKIVAAGYAVVGSGNNDFAVARYNANGSLDATFGTGGVVVTPFGALSDVANGVAVQPDGKVVAAGYTRTGSLFDFALVRYNTNGTLDASFGTGGKVTLPTAASNDMARAMALLPDGRILVAGEAFMGSNNFMVARLNANGSLDTTFGFSGLTMIDIAGGTDAAWSIAVQPDGKIVLAGTGSDGFANGFAVVRLTANGSLDDTFGNFANGTSFVDVTGTIDTAYGVAIQPDLRIVAVGASGASFAVARFFGDDTMPDAFSFPTQVDVMPYTLVTSGPATITGIVAPSPISIQYGNYSIGCTGTWESAPGFISNGQTLCVRHFSQNLLGATTQSWVTVGGVTGIFTTVTVAALDPAGDYDNDGIPNGVEATESRNPLSKDNDVFANARLFAMQQYRDFLGREGDAGGIQVWADVVTTGAWTRAQVIDAFLGSPEFSGFVAPVVRLYFATFLRVPDYAGLVFNAGLVRAGTVTLAQLAEFFAASAEFTAAYGALDNTQFVTLLYQNVLGRTPDAAGLAAWVGLLDSGYTRGQVLLGFSDSPEYQVAIANEVFVTMMYAGMMRRTPDAMGFNGWVGFLDAGTHTREQVIDGFFLSTEYRARFVY